MGLKTPTGNWTRSTRRRRPNFVHATVVVQPFAPVRLKKTSLKPRWKRRQAGRAREAMMHAMLAEIGINPVYRLGVERDSPAERSWTKRAKAWLDADQKRYAVA